MKNSLKLGAEQTKNLFCETILKPLVQKKIRQNWVMSFENVLKIQPRKFHLSKEASTTTKTKEIKALARTTQS